MGRQLMSAAEAAAALGISRRILREHVRAGAIAYVVTGRGQKRPRISFAQCDIDEFQRERTDTFRLTKAPASLIAIKKRRPHQVYFIRGGGAVKIGMAVDPKARLKDIQVGCPHELELLLVLPGGRDREKELHLRFRAAWLNGEWFTFDGPVRQFVEEQQQAGRGNR